MDSSSVSNNNNKKMCEGGWVVDDRISSLPDDIIAYILSFITPTRYSVRTSVLSKRWKLMWTLSPKLDFELHALDTYSSGKNKIKYERYKDLCVDSFIKSINNLPFLRVINSNITTFKLDFGSYFCSLRMCPNTLIRAAVMSNITELDLKIGDTSNDLGELPECLFTSKTLVVLKLFGKFIVNVPYDICLPNLKTLLLNSVIYRDDASFTKLLSGCPVLDDLEIFEHERDQMSIFNIVTSSLKRFKLYSICEENPEEIPTDDQYRIIVDAPNLEFVALNIDWFDDILLKNLGNITEAYINISNPDGDCENEFTNKVFVLLETIANVRHLYLSNDTFVYLLFDDEYNLPTFPNLVRLELCYNEYPIQLMNLLKSSPILETLSVPTMGNFSCDDEYDDSYEEFLENDPEQVPTCLIHSLKNVEIQCFKGEEVELNVVKYLLEHGMVMEKMTIFWNPCYRSKFVELGTELSSYPRLSMDCQLDLLL